MWAIDLTEINESGWGKTKFQYNSAGEIGQLSREPQSVTEPRSQRSFQYDNNQDLSRVLVRSADRTTWNELPSQDYQAKNDLSIQQSSEHGRIKTVKRSYRDPVFETFRQQDVGSVQYQYNDKGQRIQKTTHLYGIKGEQTRYRYNQAGQLSSVKLPNGQIWSYQYDPFGRRISKTYENAPSDHFNTVRYSYDGDHLIGQKYYRADGTLVKQTQWAYKPNSFVPLVQIHNETLRYIISDQIGTPRELLSDTGRVTWRGYQHLWGGCDEMNLSLNDPSQGLQRLSRESETCLIRYQGQLHDKETGLYYNRFRYYDPETSQYLSPDPIGLAGGLRPQGYVQNPLSWVDPLGLVSQDVIKNWMLANGLDPKTDLKGVYNFTDLDGKNYTGSAGTGRGTSTLLTRLTRHLTTGKLKISDLDTLNIEVMNGATDRQVLDREYEIINSNGGIGDPNVSNKRRPAGTEKVEGDINAKKYKPIQPSNIKIH